MFFFFFDRWLAIKVQSPFWGIFVFDSVVTASDKYQWNQIFIVDGKIVYEDSLWRLREYAEVTEDFGLHNKTAFV